MSLLKGIRMVRIRYQDYTTDIHTLGLAKGHFHKDYLMQGDRIVTDTLQGQ